MGDWAFAEAEDMRLRIAELEAENERLRELLECSEPARGVDPHEWERRDALLEGEE